MIGHDHARCSASVAQLRTRDEQPLGVEPDSALKCPLQLGSFACEHGAAPLDHSKQTLLTCTHYG